MRGKFTVAVNTLLLIATVIIALFLLRSNFAAISRYAELERAGCINEAALKAYSENRFRPDYRQDVAEWIAKPVFDAALLAFSLLILAVITNLVIGILALLRSKKLVCIKAHQAPPHRPE